MNKTLAVLTAGAFALVSASAFADDKTSADVTPAEQAKMKQEADAKRAAMAKMTPEERAAAKKARAAETLKYEATMEKITQDPKETRNMAINKSAAASKNSSSSGVFIVPWRGVGPASGGSRRDSNLLCGS
jgi:hypothetical protein